MKVIGIKALKDRLSEFVRIAASGETVLISDRDRVVAEMGPPSPGRAPEVADAALAAMIREGLVSPPTSPPSTPQSAPLPRAPEGERLPLSRIVDDLSRDRDDR